MTLPDVRIGRTPARRMDDREAAGLLRQLSEGALRLLAEEAQRGQERGDTPAAVIERTLARLDDARDRQIVRWWWERARAC